MTDKNGKRLKVGDWIYCCADLCLSDTPFANEITKIDTLYDVPYLNIVNPLTNNIWWFYGFEVEKLPSNEKKRNEILILRKFEQ